MLEQKVKIETGKEAEMNEALRERLTRAMADRAMDGWSGDAAAISPDDAVEVALSLIPEGREGGGDRALVAFLDEAASYFERRPTGGEDSAFWSNAYNAENCRKAARLIASLPSVGDIPDVCPACGGSGRIVWKETGIDVAALRDSQP